MGCGWGGCIIGNTPPDSYLLSFVPTAIYLVLLFVFVFKGNGGHWVDIVYAVYVVVVVQKRGESCTSPDFRLHAETGVFLSILVSFRGGHTHTHDLSRG